MWKWLLLGIILIYYIAIILILTHPDLKKNMGANIAHDRHGKQYYHKQGVSQNYNVDM